MVLSVIQTRDQLKEAEDAGENVRYGIILIMKDHEYICYDKEVVNVYKSKEERDSEYRKLYEEYRYKNIGVATEDYILEDE